MICALTMVGTKKTAFCILDHCSLWDNEKNQCSIKGFFQSYEKQQMQTLELSKAVAKLQELNERIEGEIE